MENMGPGPGNNVIIIAILTMQIIIIMDFQSKIIIIMGFQSKIIIIMAAKRPAPARSAAGAKFCRPAHRRREILAKLTVYYWLPFTFRFYWTFAFWDSAARLGRQRS